MEDAAVDLPEPRTRPVVAALTRMERALFPRWVHRLVLALAAALLGLLSFTGLAVFVGLANGDPDLQVVLGDTPVDVGELRTALLVASVGETLVGVLLLTSAVALLIARDRVGVAAGRAGLILGLAGVNVVLGYLDAETVVAVVVVELALLVGYRRYRSRFLGTAPRAESRAIPGS